MHSPLKTIKNKIKNKIDKSKLQLKKAVLKKYENETFLVNIDRFTYIIGLMIYLTYHTFLFFKNPFYIKTFYTMTNLVIILFRVKKYYGINWHMYLIDYCYIADLWIIYVVTFHYNNIWLMEIAFVHAYGL